MKPFLTIFRREVRAYTRSFLGWIVAALALLCMGVLFVTFSGKTRLASDMLTQFFRWASIVTGAAGTILSIRLISEERQTGSIVLLTTSPIREVEIIAGKFFAALAFLTLILALSVYMPFLVQIEGQITTGQILIGYVGLFLFGGATLAIGIFASSLVRQQLAAGAIAITILGLMAVLHLLASELGDTVQLLFAELDIWSVHFERSFMRGIFNSKDVVYYLAVTYFFFLLGVKTLEAKRWQ